MAQITRAGVFGYNLPPKINSTVTPAAFNIAGMIGRFARGLEPTGGQVPAILVNNVTDAAVALGEHRSGFYGRYVLDHLFQNARTNPVKVYVKPFVAADAVQATATLNDQSAVATLRLDAAYLGITDKSLDGNSTGYTLTNGTRFSTTTTGTALLGATSLVLTSVADVQVGDILKITSTGPVVHYAKVSAVNEGTKTVTISALTNATGSGDTVECLGFRIACYRKNSRGITSLVIIPENLKWLSLEPENTQYYVNTAFANHPYLKLTDLASATSPVQNTWPSDVSTVAFLASGSDGTSPVSANDWDLYSAFDTLPVRYLANPDTTLSGVNIAGESYCNGRLDKPQWVYNLPIVASKALAITLGNSYQRSDQVAGGMVYGWRNVTDPIGVGANPVIQIPNVGSVIGAWIRAFYTLGVHRAPAGDDVPLDGYLDTSSLWEDSLTDVDQADLQNAGINIIKAEIGYGISIKSFISPSTSLAYTFWNWNILQNFIKISAVESLHSSINRPNRITQLKIRGGAVEDFCRRLYDGSFPYGIDRLNGAFGQAFKADGSITQFEDVVQVQVDEFNNPNSAIANGQGDIKVWIYPTPLLRELGIGVGFVIPV